MYVGDIKLHGHSDIFPFGVNRSGPETSSTTNHIVYRALWWLHGSWFKQLLMFGLPSQNYNDSFAWVLFLNLCEGKPTHVTIDGFKMTRFLSQSLTFWLVCGSVRIKEKTLKKDTCLKEIGLHLQISITTLHSIVNTIGRTDVFSEEINKHALPITIIW